MASPLSKTRSSIENEARLDTKSAAVHKAACAITAQPPDGLAQPAQRPVLAKGNGAMVTDLDGNEYIDFAAAGGAMILGYADERVVVAMNKSVSKGCDLGTPSQAEVKLAECLVSRFTSVDWVGFAATRAEALRSAIDAARQHTSRKKLIVFEEEDGVSSDVIVLPYNDVKKVRDSFRTHGSALAAVIVEPVATRRGPVVPVGGFLAALRDVCDEGGALLILDESTTGFRLAPGSSPNEQGITGDLTVWGSLLGGGLPLAAFGGRKGIVPSCDSMRRATRHQHGSISQPALAAGLATLESVLEPDFHTSLEQRSAMLDEGLRAATTEAGTPAQHMRVGSMVGLYLEVGAARQTFQTSGDPDRFTRFHTAMLDRGIYLPADPSSCWFVSAAHTDEHIEQAVEATRMALPEIA